MNSITFFKPLMLLVFLSSFILLTPGCSSKNQQAVNDSVRSEAIDVANQLFDSIHKRDRKALRTLAAEPRAPGLNEHYQLLAMTNPGSNVDWVVTQGKLHGDINLSCRLDNGRQLVIILTRNSSQQLKFVGAVVLG
ncbi:MAG: hypothetical protein E7047_07645 [Lentisphaerae bacterium]|nr:hypothetical protein [Lentisphaerota bacterium]